MKRVLFLSNTEDNGSVSRISLESLTAAKKLSDELNGELVFSADNGISGTELWKTDGTEIGTLLISDINTITKNSINGIVLLIKKPLGLIQHFGKVQSIIGEFNNNK